MSELFRVLGEMNLLSKVVPDNSCDICNKPAPYYVTGYYVHVCGEECFEIFVNRVDIEINSLAIKKLKGMRLDGSD